jgi:hypothetical protein
LKYLFKKLISDYVAGNVDGESGLKGARKKGGERS